MKLHYKSQLIIDTVLILEGLIIFLFPKLSILNASMVFYTMMSIYAGLELIEFLYSKKTKESLYLFFSGATCAFSGFFLKSYDSSIVLSLTLITFILMVSIIKISSLQEIYKTKTNLFTIKLGALSAFILIGILVSINIFYKINEIYYMLALLYISYGGLEFGMDFLDYLSYNVKFLKE